MFTSCFAAGRNRPLGELKLIKGPVLNILISFALSLKWHQFGPVQTPVRDGPQETGRPNLRPCVLLKDAYITALHPRCHTDIHTQSIVLSGRLRPVTQLLKANGETGYWSGQSREWYVRHSKRPCKGQLCQARGALMGRWMLLGHTLIRSVHSFRCITSTLLTWGQRMTKGNIKKRIITFLLCQILITIFPTELHAWLDSTTPCS